MCHARARVSAVTLFTLATHPSRVGVKTDEWAENTDQGDSTRATTLWPGKRKGNRSASAQLRKGAIARQRWTSACLNQCASSKPMSETLEYPYANQSDCDSNCSHEALLHQGTSWQQQGDKGHKQLTSKSDSKTVCSPIVSVQKSRAPRRTKSWRIGDGDLVFGASRTRIVWMSRGTPMASVPGTSLCVREYISVRVHAARFLSPANPISRRTCGRLTPFDRAPTWFTLTSSCKNCEFNLWMWLCISFQVTVFVNRSPSLSIPATLWTFRSPPDAFSWIHK